METNLIMLRDIINYTQDKKINEKRQFAWIKWIIYMA